MSEFDLVGPQFLAFYTPLTFGTIFGAAIVRWLLSMGRFDERDMELSTYEAAYLAGGDDRVADAAVAKLIADKVVSGERGTLRVVGSLTGNASPAERAVFRALEFRSITSLGGLYRNVSGISETIRPRLIEAGLILSDARVAATRVICTLMTLSPVLFWGAPKVFIGFERHKPVNLLVLLCLMGLTASWYFVRITFARTARGSAALSYLKTEGEPLRYSVQYGKCGSGVETAMATALYGTGILLAMNEFQVLRPALSTSGGSGWGFSSSCGDSGSGCGGGSSCGGGGCGGGGCGGCGG